jgi:hypothetical protein
MVFGLFKKKPDPTQVAIKVSSNTLQIQLTLGGAGTQRIEHDKFALGYLFGFNDGVLQALRVIDQTQGLAAMAVSYTNLFGAQAGPILLRKCLDLQRDQTFMRGMFVETKNPSST